MSNQYRLDGSDTRGGAPAPAPLPRRILVADDDIDMRMLLGTVLRHDGYEVTECDDGEALLAQIDSAEPPDLVVSDVQMPRSTGLRVLSRLRRSHPQLPVVLITAFGSLELHREAQRLGAAVVLDKPFGVSTLRELVRRLLENMDAQPEGKR